MRIRFLSSRQRAPETGAIAIIVSLLMVALLIFAAFAVDIGNAYANSRQLSVAADAAAIAAARAVGEVAPNGVSCADALAAIDEQQIAADAADELNTKNNRANGPSDSEPVDSVAVECIDSNDDGTDDAVAVTVNNSRSVNTFFGGITGVDAIAPRASATAIFAKVPVPSGLRPWAVCDETAKFAYANQDETFFTGLDNKLGVCSKGPTAGNWGSVDFDGQLGNPANSAKVLAEWTLNGYSGPELTIPGLFDADPGVSGSISLRDAFAAITGDIVSFPAVPECIGDCAGATAQFDTQGVITVLVCGVQYQGSVVGTPVASCWKDPATWLDTGTVRTLSDAAISENSKTLTSATAAFTDLDKAPRVVIVKGAGPGVPAGDLVSRIKKVNSATSVELEDRADTTVSGAKLELGLPIIPQEASGKFVDHIQFRGRQYFVPNGVIGGAFEPCLFDSRLCAGAVLLWR